MRSTGQDATKLLLKALVQHPISFVQHEGRQVFQRELTPRHKVKDTPRRPSAPVNLFGHGLPLRPHIHSAGRATNQDITHTFHVCSNKREKLSRLVAQLRENHEGERMIVFMNTKVSCAELQARLVEQRDACETLNGDMDQATREASLEAFRACRPGLLVATDVAARGLDIDDVSVVNFDMASTCDSFVHRVGRTGRAGKKGLAVSLLNRLDKNDLRVACEVADHFGTAGKTVPAGLEAFLQEVRERAADAGLETGAASADTHTHNTGLTDPQVKLQGHQLARVLAAPSIKQKHSKLPASSWL